MRTADFISAVLRNPIHERLLDQLDRNGLPEAWIVAGCLTQTVWNIQTGRQIDYGINDYDIFYFDPDLSWNAENQIISGFRELSDRIGRRIEVRNQARVHLWYTEKHGKPYPALSRATEGIDRFLTRCTQVGIQRADRDIRLYAPRGLDDVSALIVRPNRSPNFSAQAYDIKTARWRSLWPELVMLTANNDAAS